MNLLYAPKVIMVVDMRGKLKLHAPSWAAVYSHFHRQVEATRKLSVMLKRKAALAKVSP